MILRTMVVEMYLRMKYYHCQESVGNGREHSSHYYGLHETHT